MADSKLSLKTERNRAGFRSYDQLAEEVLRRWAKLEPKAKRPRVRSLAAKLVELERNPVWWRNHPKASQALAAALGLRIEDLPLSTVASAPRRHGFEDFRDLPELDLSTEDPCRLMAEPWWSADLLRGRTWVDAPRGTGKTLAAAIHRARGEHVIEVVRLSDAIPQVPADAGARVVIRVQGPDPETDGTAADQLRSRDWLLVLANFAPPEGPRQRARAEEVFKEYPMVGRSPENAAELVRVLMWKTQTWAPIPGWRDEFCRWIFERLHADERRLAPVRQWLDEHDRDERLFRTPGDVLAVLGRAWESSIARLRPDGLIRWWIDRRLTGPAADGGSRGDWLAAHGEKALRALADAAFNDAAVSFPARMSSGWWSEKLPEAIAPAAPVLALTARVQEIAQEQRQGQRAALARAWARDAARASAAEAIGHLRAAGVFQPGGAGVVELAPPWVVEWWAEARAKELLRGEPAVWGRLAATPSRRRLVEKVLDGLDGSHLRVLVELALAACAKPRAELGAVAAIEALFGAVGRRHLRSSAEIGLPLKLLHALLAEQRTWLRGDHIPRPLTRASSEQPGDAPWVAECWAWSFAVPRPAGFPDDAIAWLFPGWSPVSLATSPQWLRSLRAENSPSFGFLLQLAGRVMQKIDDDLLPDRLPEPLLIEAMVRAQTRGWILAGDHVDELMNREPVARMFAERVRTLDLEHRRDLIGDFWRALSMRPDWTVPRFHKERPEILELLADVLDPSEVEGAAERGCIGFGSLADRLRWPPAWWNAAIRVLAPRHRERLRGLHGIYLDATAVESLEVLIDNDEDAAYWMGTLWRIAPHRARERANAAYPDGPQAALWFSAAPREARASLLDLIRAPVGTWTRNWLAHILPEADADAERVFQLLTS